MKNVSRNSVKVSVVIPTYNMSHYLEDAIGSVLVGDLEDVEVIVIDDGSTDDTATQMKPYVDATSHKYDPRVRFFQQENQGKSAAVNQGLRVAEGLYVTMLDADDQLTVDSLETRYESRLDGSGNLHELVIGGFEVFDDSQTYGKRLPPVSEVPSNLHDQFYLRWRTPFHLNAALISQKLITKAGGLDEKVHRCIDGDYALRLLEEAKSINVVEDIVYRYRKHRSSAFERVKYRVKTAWYRPKVIWKNYEGWRRWVAVPFGLVMDSGKLLYELIGSYKS